MGKNHSEKPENGVIMDNTERRELTLVEIQNIELSLLLIFHNICKSQKLRYSLGGGSLLGAVRHAGFIPWDDDIDVMMPRPDYERFIHYCKQNPVPFALITYDTVDGYYGLFAKLSDLSTVITDKVMKLEYSIGINIDVFPVDGLGDSEKEAVKIFRKTEIDREILNAVIWKTYFRSKTHSIIVEPVRLGLFFISRFVDPKKLLRKIDRVNLNHSFEKSKYAGCVCGSYRTKEIMTKETFEHYTDIKFENETIKAIANYDEYLQKHYGDYMQLPPEEKRVTHHTYQAFRR